MSLPSARSLSTLNISCNITARRHEPSTQAFPSSETTRPDLQIIVMATTLANHTVLPDCLDKLTIQMACCNSNFGSESCKQEAKEKVGFARTTIRPIVGLELPFDYACDLSISTSLHINCDTNILDL